MSSRAFVMHADVLAYFGARLEVVHLTHAKWSYSNMFFQFILCGFFFVEVSSYAPIFTNSISLTTSIKEERRAIILRIFNSLQEF
jgi:hypothetical protein